DAAGVTGIKHRASAHGPHDDQVSQPHLRRAIFADAHAHVRPRELQVRPRNPRHANLVAGAAKETSERGRKRHFAARAETHGQAHQVLLGDKTFGKAIWEPLVKLFRVSGILRVAVHRHDARVNFADADQGVAVGLARGDQIAEFVSRWWKTGRRVILWRG